MTQENATARPLVEVRSIMDDFEDGSGSGRNPAGVRVTPETAVYSTAVLACIRVLAESLASLPLHVYRRIPGGGKEQAIEVPLYRVLHDSPNGWQTSFEWRETLMAHLCLYGNAYCEIRSGASGAASELIPLHPSRMVVERIENGRLRYTYSEPGGGGKTVYSQDMILHIRWLSSDSIVGLVPVELSRDAIALARACEIHGARFFGGGARPGMILQTDHTLTEEAVRLLRDNWERAHRGSQNSHRTAILTGGLKAQEVGTSNADSQFLESRRYQTEEICRIFRVPPHMIMELSRSTFSNIEHQGMDFVTHSLMPWCRRFESAFTRDLLTDQSLFVEFDVRGLLRGDAAARASYYQTMFALGVLSTNEIRVLENMNPVPGGDARYVPMNMQELGGVPEPDPEPEPEPQPEATEPAADPNTLAG